MAKSFISPFMAITIIHIGRVPANFGREKSPGRYQGGKLEPGGHTRIGGDHLRFFLGNVELP